MVNCFDGLRKGSEDVTIGRQSPAGADESFFRPEDHPKKPQKLTPIFISRPFETRLALLKGTQHWRAGLFSCPSPRDSFRGRCFRISSSCMV